MADGEGGHGESGNGDDAARAFEDLRGEITLLRRAIERLAAERADGDPAPDYSETLGVIAHNVTATAQAVDVLARSSALSLTPEEIGRQILAAGYDARREEQRQFGAARHAMEEIVAQIGRRLHSHDEAGEQRRGLWRVGWAGLAAGMVLWASLAGPIARTMPASWQWPERMAARALDMPMWKAGQHLMRTAAPEVFAGDRIVIANRKVLEACQNHANITVK